MPGRRTAPHLRVLHVEGLRRRVRRAQRIGADAFGRGLVDPVHMLLPLAGAPHALAEIVVDDRPAGRFREPRHQPVAHLRFAAAPRLDDAGAHFAQNVREGENFIFVRPQCRDVHALRIVMALVARHREAERARFHAVAHDVLHLFEFGIGRGAFLALVIHDVVAHRGVADQRPDIDAQIAVEPLHVLRERFPIDFHRAEHLHRDRLDIGEEFGHPLFLALLHRGEGEGAIADHDAGRAMVAGEGAERVPGDLRIVMAMIVDKAGADHSAFYVDRLAGRAGQFAHLDDLAVLDRDIAVKGGHARAVDDPAVLDQDVIRHRISSSPMSRELPLFAATIAR